MAADFQTSRIPDLDTNGVSQGPGTTGTVMSKRRMLGAEGAGVTGRGSWFSNRDLWKTFFLYNFDRTGAVDAGVDVRIEVCMELAEDPNDPDVDTTIFELATLTAASPNFSTEEPWRYIRARVHAHAGAENVQVGLSGQGQ